MCEISLSFKVGFLLKARNKIKNFGKKNNLEGNATEKKSIFPSNFEV